MTCRLAFSYNRDVYALPGRVDDIRSQGCNELIRRKIAEPVTSEKELIDSLGLKMRNTCQVSNLEARLVRSYESAADNDRIDMMKNIILAIKKHRGISVEELSELTGIGYIKTSELTGMLEIDGFICIDLLQRCSINYKNV